MITIKTSIENLIDWPQAVTKQLISENVLKKYANKFCKYTWDNVCQYQNLSEQFMKQFAGKLNWNYVAIHQHLSESFIQTFKHKFPNWFSLVVHQHLSEKIIEKMFLPYYASTVLEFQQLSEDFILKHPYLYQNYYSYVFKYQKISQNFIQKMKNISPATYEPYLKYLSNDFPDLGPSPLYVNARPSYTFESPFQFANNQFNIPLENDGKIIAYLYTKNSYIIGLPPHLKIREKKMFLCTPNKPFILQTNIQNAQPIQQIFKVIVDPNDIIVLYPDSKAIVASKFFVHSKVQ